QMCSFRKEPGTMRDRGFGLGRRKRYLVSVPQVPEMEASIKVDPGKQPAVRAEGQTAGVLIAGPAERLKREPRACSLSRTGPVFHSDGRRITTLLAHAIVRGRLAHH